MINFRGDPDHDADPGIFKRNFYHCAGIGVIVQILLITQEIVGRIHWSSFAGWDVSLTTERSTSMLIRVQCGLKLGNSLAAAAPTELRQVIEPSRPIL